MSHFEEGGGSSDKPAGAGSSQRPEYADERDDAALWAAIDDLTEPSGSSWFFPTIVVILLASAPWLLPGSIHDRLWAGLPVWVWKSLLGALLIALCTAYAALRLWRDDGSDAPAASDRCAPEERV